MIDAGAAGAAAAGSRRQLLGGTARLGLALAAGGAAVAAAGCGSPAPAVKRVPAGQRGPVVAELDDLLDLVHPTIAAYTAGIPLLTGSAQPVARQFLSEELEHAGRLQSLIRALGKRPRPPQPHPDLGTPGSAHDVLLLLHRLEGRQLAGFRATLPRAAQAIRLDLASILANDAQHLCILRSFLGLEPSPAPFLTATE